LANGRNLPAAPFHPVHSQRVYQYHMDTSQGSARVTEEHVLGLFDAKATAAAASRDAAAAVTEAGKAWQAYQQQQQQQAAASAVKEGSDKEADSAAKGATAAAAGDKVADGNAAAKPVAAAAAKGADGSSGSSKAAAEPAAASAAAVNHPPPMLELLDYLPDTASMLQSHWPYFRQMYMGEQHVVCMTRDAAPAARFCLAHPLESSVFIPDVSSWKSFTANAVHHLQAAACAHAIAREYLLTASSHVLALALPLSNSCASGIFSRFRSHLCAVAADIRFVSPMPCCCCCRSRCCCCYCCCAGGEKCGNEGAGKPRQVELRFACSPHNSWRMLVREPQFCSYVVVVYHPGLCKVPRYAPVPVQQQKPQAASAAAAGSSKESKEAAAAGKDAGTAAAKPATAGDAKGQGVAAKKAAGGKAGKGDSSEKKFGDKPVAA
jgi:hypothetical protein